MITLEGRALIMRLAAESVAKARIAQQLRISRATALKTLGSDAPPGYERSPGPTCRASRQRDWPSGSEWTGSVRWGRENASCDLWFPPRKISLEDGAAKLMPVVVITAAHSRFVTKRIIPSRKIEDLPSGSQVLIQQPGRVP